MAISPPLPSRVRSIDALRGFDMFWIIGGDAVLDALTKGSPNSPIRTASLQFIDHVEWAGFRFYDMIFPLFLFIIGVTLPFSILRRFEAGESRRSLLIKVFKRAAILFLLGMIYNGCLQAPDWAHVRIFGVLQRQAIGYLAASILVLTTRPKTQWIVPAAILMGYWGVLTLVPVPGFPLGTMSPTGNVANYVDRLVLQPHQMYESYGDPEGPVSMIPAVATALIGVFAGMWLRTSRPEERKSLGLAVAGIVLLAAGWAWSPLLPVIKKIWTSSYTLVAGGMSLLLLASFHYVIDAKGWWKWSFPFIVIGMNPITIYMLSAIVDFGAIAGFFVNGLAGRYPELKEIIIAASALSLKWLLLYFLYRQKVFVKV